MDFLKTFGCKTFSYEVMREHLPDKVYRSLKDTGNLGKPLDPSIADVVAAVMKDWAVGQGATHYSHWFHPLSNIAAGKHDAFLSIGPDGRVMSEFSSKALVRGEPDASSFPSGGLRAAFEARGYTFWDPSSPAFIRDGTLYIPTAYCAYSGESLDSKTPLLRAMQALNPQALRILKALGHEGSRQVTPTVGAEQEYFLVDRELYESRLDLKLCGTTLIGAKPPKGQELDDHYCGPIRLRVGEFMRELDRELWELGIPSKTKHNETAPAQHEMAPIYQTVNIAADNNLCTMESMRIIAKKHGLSCLLHEKPFAGVNGSGKHNNFSLSSDDGINFLKPGKNPAENKLFLVTLCALIEVSDSYADLIRLAAASPGNDHRLGGFEAPPAIISMFLGEHLTEIITSIARGIRPSLRPALALDTGVDVLPNLRKDSNDRNRTSPLSFTGDKFEFRMLGSSQLIAFINVVLTTGLADVFARFAQRLENCGDLENEVAQIVADTVQNHERIIFNGNNYTREWVEEAARRGLPNLPSTAQAIDALISEKNMTLFARQGVFSETECRARHEILLENFVKVVNVEAETLLYMVERQIYPAGVAYLGEVAGSLNAVQAAGIKNPALTEHLANLNNQTQAVSTRCEALRLAANPQNFPEDLRDRSDYCQNTVRKKMTELREACDVLETMVSAERWPIPTYADLLHDV
ncbi:MAG: glutamine synthetase III [Oscillospiraceae bacterium]|nr:glutamine synthetase III [Oscillospiraceae bacterium]